MSEPNKGGRPTLSDSERRTHRITVTLNDQEFKAIEEKANGYPLPLWLRMVAIQKAHKGECK